MSMSGRQYSASFNNVSVSAVQDLLAVYTGSSKIVAIQSVELSQITQATIGSLQIRLRYLPSSVTTGSGGSSVTPVRQVSGDAASTATARSNDTTQATSSSAVTLWADQWNLLNGFLWVPPSVSRPPVIGLSGAFVVSLDSAPASAIFCSGTVVYEELP